MSRDALAGLLLVVNGQRIAFHIVDKEHDVVDADEKALSKLPDPFGVPAAILAQTLTPKMAHVGQTFEFFVDELRFLGFPVAVRTPFERGGDTGGDGSRMRTAHGTATTQARGTTSRRDDADDDHADGSGIVVSSFSVVFVVKGFDADSALFHDAVKRITLVLEYEERRCGYLSLESSKMFSARENCVPESPTARLTNADITAALVRASKLAETLQSLYESLRSTGVASANLNGWISLSLTLSPMQRVDREILPHQCIILTEPARVIRARLPPDTMDTVTLVVDLADPFVPIRDLAAQSGLSLKQIHLVCQHLLRWGMARVIDAVADTNVYIPTRLASPSDAEAAELHRSGRLGDLLEAFSAAKPYSEVRLTHSHSPALMSHLLRTRQLAQLYEFVVALVPRSAMDDTIVIRSCHRVPNAPAAAGPAQHGATSGLPASSGGRDNHNSPSTHAQSTGVVLGTGRAPPPELEPFEVRYFTSKLGDSDGLPALLRLVPHLDGVNDLRTSCHVAGVAESRARDLVAEYRELFVTLLAPSPSDYEYLSTSVALLPASAWPDMMRAHARA